MKYAITGHTKGIGKAFAELDEVKDNFIGFSRVTGHNIKNKEHTKKIINEPLDCDVFINNSYNLYHQTDLLYELHRKWKHLPKTIVNMSSYTTETFKDFPHTYQAHKGSLDMASLHLDHMGKCNCILIKFGYVGSEKILKFVKPKTYIDVNHAAEMIFQAVQWSDKYKVKQITITPG